MIEQIGQEAMTVSCMQFESVELNQRFYFRQKDGAFNQLLYFFYNSNVKLKYIFEYLCWDYMNQKLAIFLTSKLVSVQYTKKIDEHNWRKIQCNALSHEKNIYHSNIF